jgi:hypothetical protein
MIAECGTGKTLISLGSIFTAAQGRKFTALALVPPHLVAKWTKECHLTLPGVRVFIVDGVQESGRTDSPGQRGRLRVAASCAGSENDLGDGGWPRPPFRAAAGRRVGAPSVWVLSRDRQVRLLLAHAYATPKCGVHRNVVNPDTGADPRQ